MVKALSIFFDNSLFWKVGDKSLKKQGTSAYLTLIPIRANN